MGQNTPSVPDEKIRCHRFSWNFAGMLYEYQATKVQKDFSLSSFVVQIQHSCKISIWTVIWYFAPYMNVLDIANKNWFGMPTLLNSIFQLRKIIAKLMLNS